MCYTISSITSVVHVATFVHCFETWIQIYLYNRAEQTASYNICVAFIFSSKCAVVSFVLPHTYTNLASILLSILVCKLIKTVE